MKVARRVHRDARKQRRNRLANAGGLAGSGPEVNTAVVTPGGTRLAFISERSLPTANFPAGYDNEQA